MVPNSEWVLASGNKGKLREFQDLFAPWGVNWVAQGELGVPDAEEPFHKPFIRRECRLYPSV